MVNLGGNMDHIPQETLERFMRCKTTRFENREVVAHLLHGCEKCAEIARESCSAVIPESVYAEVFDRVAESFLRQRRLLRFPSSRQVPAGSLW